MKRITLLSVLVLLGISAACAQEDTSAAQRAMLEWLSVLDAENYSESWQMTGTIFRNQVTAEQWSQSASAARSPFGTLKERRVVRATATSSLPNAPSGDYVVMRTRADFNDQSATETVTAVLEDGQWRVVGYFIN